MSIINSTNAWVHGVFPQKISFVHLMDNLPIGVVLLSRERRVVYINSAMEGLTGFERSQVLGKKCAHFLRGNQCMIGCPLAQLENERESLVFEGNIIDHNRQKIETRHTLARLVDASGETQGYIEVVEDLRTIKRAGRQEIRTEFLGNILGNCPEMQKVFSLVPVIGQTDSSVLITGETGTGKDLLAEAIHQHSPRAKGPFIKVNCGALPETLLESELFGHKKGAFTGATQDKPGWFKLANNGTLFLTEIGDLPLSLQVKLLTFLDDKVIYPLGSTKGVQVNVRVIAATHRNLEEMVRLGTFRQDLLFRLNVIRVHLPPLRERGDDVRLLLYHFLNQFSEELKKDVHTFSPQALNVLLNYTYPGNVRELRNIVEYALAICDGNQIGLEHLPAYLRTSSEPALSPLNNLNHPSLVDSGTDSGTEAKPKTWSDMEKEMILKALVEAGGKKALAAKRLGWGRSTLWRKMKKYNLD
ncbi:sigma 54-interacting transcriptional regulator [Desulfohalobiaceae bacterium Ax17]|jgi:PAS domain S-box-containing protein|uniref:sigma-54 interaction domain-containing protein n=1 Tax=Desulfovulcanus ferrireducens TaxID=2831190 RepID=UPI00207BCF81|nr:sigma 54-interacting transcriptional regulator [Desulfovulcanus ferrireducens]MBT8763737.1 sigma 54-interacting transcriptional regulator [Desulfovulcanus ferrireducens]